MDKNVSTMPHAFQACASHSQIFQRDSKSHSGRVSLHFIITIRTSRFMKVWTNFFGGGTIFHVYNLLSNPEKTFVRVSSPHRFYSLLLAIYYVSFFIFLGTYEQKWCQSGHTKVPSFLK